MPSMQVNQTQLEYVERGDGDPVVLVHGSLGDLPASSGFWTPFSCEDGARVQAPTLLLHGGQSLRMFELVVQELARCLPNNELVCFPDSTHDVPGDAP